MTLTPDEEAMAVRILGHLFLNANDETLDQLDGEERSFCHHIVSDLDMASSVSRQHFIDTGRYMTHEEVAETLKNAEG